MVEEADSIVEKKGTIDHLEDTATIEDKVLTIVDTKNPLQEGQIITEEWKTLEPLGQNQMVPEGWTDMKWKEDQSQRLPKGWKVRREEIEMTG
jgi:hypothetical protein